jgi:hypothetical protein
MVQNDFKNLIGGARTCTTLKCGIYDYTYYYIWSNFGHLLLHDDVVKSDS